jgi:hypothetical protein
MEPLLDVAIPRDMTDAYLKQAGHGLDIVFDIDLGELVEGHHVIARGVDLGRRVDLRRWEAELQQQFESEMEEEEARLATQGMGLGSVQTVRRRILTEQDREVVGSRLLESELHYEFVPGLVDDKEGFYWYWMLHTSDDLGTPYSDANNGTRGPATGGSATHATRDLGARIPSTATRLRISFSTASGWEPYESWVKEIEIDLLVRSVISVTSVAERT